MEYNFYLQECGDDDVVSFENTMFKLGKFRNAMNFAFTDQNQVRQTLYYGLQQKGVEISTKELLGDGEDCEVLKLGAKAWQKGKIRIRVTVEFCPNEPENSQLESPLDDIRQMMNENTQQGNS